LACLFMSTSSCAFLLSHPYMWELFLLHLAVGVRMGYCNHTATHARILMEDDLRYDDVKIAKQPKEIKQLKVAWSTSMMLKALNCFESASSLSRAYAKMMDWCRGPDLNQRQMEMSPAKPPPFSISAMIEATIQA